jgi:hypothetical protein
LRYYGLGAWSTVKILGDAPTAAYLRRKFRESGDRHFFAIKVPFRIHNEMKADRRTGANTIMDPWALPDGCDIIKFD